MSAFPHNPRHFVSDEHTLAHALRPADTNCRHEMKDIQRCVICGRTLLPDRDEVDTCGKRCAARLRRMQG